MPTSKASRTPPPPVIPSFVVEYFLLGKTRRDSHERFTQDGGVVTDVWLAFAADRTKPQRVLIQPTPGTTAMMLGSALHDAIMEYRAANPPATTATPTSKGKSKSKGKGKGKKPGAAQKRELPNVSPLENYVAATITFYELLRIVLPMTAWWRDKRLSALRKTAAQSGWMLQNRLEHAIKFKLGVESHQELDESGPQDVTESPADRRITEAASIAALLGVFCAADYNPKMMRELGKINPKTPEGEQQFIDWVAEYADAIAQAARIELTRQFEAALGPQLQAKLHAQMAYPRAIATLVPEEPPALIQRVFLNRKGSLATVDGIAAIKADAATRLFDVSCNQITWAMIDAGLDPQHEAFLDHDALDIDGKPIVPPPSRIRGVYDFTLLHLIRNFDLTIDPQAVDDVVQALKDRRPGNQDIETRARKFLPLIAEQMRQKLPPDWNVIEQLIAIQPNEPSTLFDDHGTHVAGILGADWRVPPPTAAPGAAPPAATAAPEVKLQGVCPDIKLYDLRVVDPEDRKAAEFSLLSAVEFVQFLNAREAGSGPAVHGVNISLSIPHEVKSYGCGATPVCVACDRLASSGVIVIAAAGNRGWNEQEIGFGNFVFCSVTDPGNARDVITVGSTHAVKPHTFGVSYFSSRGPTGDGRVKPDLVAPGEQIRGPIRNNAEDEKDGTSMAAPFVSGAAAMLLSRHRELIGNPARVKQVLCDSATDLGREKYFQGHGLVDVLRALQSV